MPKSSPNSTKNAYRFSQKIAKLFQEVKAIDEQKLNNRLVDISNELAKQTTNAEKISTEIIEKFTTDILRFAYFMEKTSANVVDWLKFDIAYLEEPIAKMLLSISDQTKLEYEQTKFDLKNNFNYTSGDLVLIGSFACTKCNHEFVVYHIDYLKDCYQCKNKKFLRLTNS